MPLIRVSLLDGVFSDEQRQQMVVRLADTMAEVVGEPYRQVTWVLIDDVRSGELSIGGNPITTEQARSLARPPVPAG